MLLHSRAEHAGSLAVDDCDGRQSGHDGAREEVVHLEEGFLGAHAAHIDFAFRRADVEFTSRRISSRLRLGLGRVLLFLDQTQLILLDRHLHRTGLHLHVAVLVGRSQHGGDDAADVQQAYAIAFLHRTDLIGLDNALLDAAALLVLGLGDDTAQSGLCCREILVGVLLLRLLFERFQFVKHGFRRHAGVFQDVVRLSASALHHLVHAVLGSVALGTHLVALGLGGRAHALCLFLHLLDTAAFALEFGQYVLETGVFGGNLLLGPLDDGRLQPQTRRNSERIRLARNAGQQAVGRLQRLDVKLAGGVLYAVRGQRERFELGVMGRGGNARAHLAGVADDSNCQSRTLDRVGTGTQFVEQHEVALPAAVHDGHDGLHVRGKRRKALLYALLVANIGVNVLEKADFRLLIRRNMQAACRHQRQQAKGFERNRLAAGVRAGDDERVVIVADGDVNRNRLILVQQRMARAEQLAAVAVLDQHRRTGVHVERQLGTREDEVQRGQRVVVLLDRALVHGHARGQLRENALDLVFLAALKHLNLVVDLHDLLRLDEHSRAGGRGIVHQTGHIAAVLHLDRHNEAAVSLGDDGLLQVLGAFAGNHAVERFAHLAGHAAQFPADGQQLRRRTVRNLLLGDDGGRDGFLQIAVAGEQAENGRERGLVFVLGVVQQGTSSGLQQACHRQQLSRVERAAAVRAGQDRADLADAAKSRTALPNHQVFRIRGLLQP